MADKFLYETLDSAFELGFLKKEIPDFLKDNLNPEFELRPYQTEAFVRMLDRQMDALKKQYDGIYLIRNERHFKIYNFSDGRAFEPDFVLFLHKKNGNMLTYQIFIEPKGKHLKEHDKWKQDFLKEITKKFEGKTLE